MLSVPSHKHCKAQWLIPQKHAYNLQNLHLFISFHINSLDIQSHTDSSHIHKSFSFFFVAMPSSVVLRSLRFLFTLLSTHNTTRPRTHRRKMERGRKRRRRIRRRKWEREMPPPMSGLEISRNLCQRNWWGNPIMLVVLVVDVQNFSSWRVSVNCISVHQIKRSQRNNNGTILN